MNGATTYRHSVCRSPFRNTADGRGATFFTAFCNIFLTAKQNTSRRKCCLMPWKRVTPRLTAVFPNGATAYRHSLCRPPFRNTADEQGATFFTAFFKIFLIAKQNKSNRKCYSMP
ncbi:hypothetical protein AVEN_164059-1 [Araneus ventricosus]|uniref:Uncharacterized protein n=1 Tax=Araneus ventricosus TaxID=182803 RepID=A0A4Y2G085_ARAVE|nr:hypothetical protein AVEN_164059-1 [Araneus ventricosus]